MPNMYGNDPYAVSRRKMIERTRQEFSDPMTGEVDEESFHKKVLGNMYDKGDTAGVEKYSRALSAQWQMRQKEREDVEEREAPADLAQVYDAVMANKRNLGTSMDPDTFAALNAAAANPKSMKVMKDIKDTKGEKKPKTLTLSQQARNDEIDAARAEFANMGLTKEEVQKRTKQFGATGRTNADYDPVVGKIYNKAVTRKVGDDPDYREFYNSFVGAGKAEKPAVKSGSIKVPKAKVKFLD